MTIVKMNLVAVASSIIAMCCWQTCNGKETVYLLRGSGGVIPINATQNQLREFNSVYWYLGNVSTDGLLISNIEGKIEPRYGISKDRYDIDWAFSLVIRNVSKLDQGTYCYWFKKDPVEHFYGIVNVVVKDDVVFLERGKAGKLLFLPTVYNQYHLREDDFVFWYYPNQNEFLVSCAVGNGSIQLYPSKAESYYGVDENCSLIILKVADSDEGFYHYELWERRLQIPEGRFILEVKESSSTESSSTTETGTNLQMSTTLRTRPNGDLPDTTERSSTESIVTTEEDTNWPAWAWVLVGLIIGFIIVIFLYLVIKKYLYRKAWQRAKSVVQRARGVVQRVQVEQT